MEKEMIVKLHSEFESISYVWPDAGTEYWLARDLQEAFGYARWENFYNVINKAIISCKTSGYDPDDHFLEVTKMVDLGSDAQREISDIALSRYASYLVAQNGDSAKPAIAFAQTYFALQTRKQELIEERISEIERLDARKRLIGSEKELSGLINERLGSSKSFAIVRSKGDKALFGGKTTLDMKKILGVPKARALADFLPTITIKAKDFANEITNFNIEKEEMGTMREIVSEHIKNNADIRKLLADRGIKPEELPAAEDVKKIERRVVSEQKKLSKNPDKLEIKDQNTEGE